MRRARPPGPRVFFHGVIQTQRAPTSGTRIRTVVKSGHREEDEDEDGSSGSDGKRVRAHAAGLDSRELVGGEANSPAELPERAEKDGLLDVPRREHRCS